MSGPDLIEALVTAGYAEVDAASRAELVSRAERAFVHSFGAPPVWRWVVPGRIELFGKHTDYAGGRSLVCAVPRGFAFVASPRDDGRVFVQGAADDGWCSIDPHSATTAVGWQNYLVVVARRLCQNFVGRPLGVNVVMQSDLPRAAGLSSSSALVVGLATVLIRRGRLTDTPEWRRAIGSDQHLAWYLGCVENGLDFPGLPGAAGVGTLGGSEDHTAILTCKAGHVSVNRYAPVVHVGDVAMPSGWRLVVATSGVHADKAGAALERYNRLSRGTQVLSSLWEEATGRRAGLLAAALEAAGGAGPLYDLIERATIQAFTRQELASRLTHFVREDTRVADAARALAAADRTTFAALASDTQRDADELLGNQIDETRALVEEALTAGAWAASSFGAGFGGSVWALVAAGEATSFGPEWIARYRARCPQVGPTEWFEAPPVPGRLDVSVARP